MQLFLTFNPSGNLQFLRCCAISYTPTILTIIIFPVLDKRLKLRVGTRVYLVSSWNKPGTEADIGSLSVNTCHYQTMSHSQFIFLPSPSFFLHQIPGCPCTDLHVRARAVCRSCGFLPPTPSAITLWSNVSGECDLVMSCTIMNVRSWQRTHWCMTPRTQGTQEKHYAPSCFNEHSVWHLATFFSGVRGRWGGAAPENVETVNSWKFLHLQEIKSAFFNVSLMVKTSELRLQVEEFERRDDHKPFHNHGHHFCWRNR